MLLSNQKYAALICDIEGSKELDGQRNFYQLRLIDTLKSINESYNDSIELAFQIYNGDEFQGLINDFSVIPKIIYEIEKNLMPVKVNIGIGIGTVATDLKISNTFVNDGEAYYCARNALNEVKEGRNKHRNIDTNIILRASFENDFEKVINTIFSLCFIIKSNWTKKQQNIISSLEEHDDVQHLTAKNLNISHTGVSRALDRARYYSVKDAYHNLYLIFKELGEDKGV